MVKKRICQSSLLNDYLVGLLIPSFGFLFFVLQMLYDDEPGVEDVSCGLSL